MPRLIPALSSLGLVLLSGACVSANPEQELSVEQACLQHFEHDPVGRDRCRMSADNRTGSVPDVRPQDLPIRTGQPSD